MHEQERKDERGVYLSTRWAAVCRSGEVLLLATDEESVVLTGAVYCAVVQALADSRSEEQAEQRLSSQFHPGEIRQALKELRSIGLIRDEAPTDPYRSAYWESASLKPREGEVAMFSLVPQAAALMKEAFASNHIAVTENAELTLVLTDDYLRPELSQLDGLLLLTKPVGPTIWIGPLVRRGGACLDCLRAWMRPHRWQQASVLGCSGNEYLPAPSTGSLPSTVAIAAGMISTLIASCYERLDELPVADNILALDTRSMSVSTHPVLPRPDCARCHDLALSMTRDVHSLVSPLTGLISDLYVAESPVGGHFHAHATLQHALPKDNARPLLRPTQAIGKGITPFDARASCLYEAVERYSITFRGDEPMEFGSTDEIGGIAFEDLLLFSKSQYARREALNKLHSELHWVPEQLDRSLKIHWIAARSLADGTCRFIPAAYCYMYFGLGKEANYCAADTNGCAAGSDLISANLAALLELVERDAVAIWWYNRLRRPAIDLACLNDEHLLESAAAFGDIRRQVYVLDITTDCGIPSYAAIAPKLDGSEPCFGSAAHTSAAIAVRKAIAEAAQVCFWSSQGGMTGELEAWLKSATLENEAFLNPLGTVAATGFAEYRGADRKLAECVERIRATGTDVFAVDMTRAETGVVVSRAVAPGLRHFWRRLGGGRLYEVPVRMGWAARRCSEEEMNPVACMN